MGLGLGMSTVELQASFAAPGRLGDLLDIDVAMTRVGRSSVDLALTISCDGEPRFAVTYTQVLIHVSDARAVPWPEPLRVALTQALEPTDTG